jgi:hypothetical protein
MTAPAKSAAWDGLVGVVEVMRGDSGLASVLAKDAGDVAARVPAPRPAIYNQTAPAGAAMPYVVLGTATETKRSTFGRGGSDLSATWHIYAAGPDDSRALAIHEHLFRLFAGQRVPIPGHRVARVDLALVAVYPDPGGAMHGLERVTMHTQALP